VRRADMTAAAVGLGIRRWREIRWWARYTPTVGEACQKFGQMPFYSRGCYVSITDRGNLKAVLLDYAAAHLEVRMYRSFGAGCQWRFLALSVALAGVPCQRRVVCRSRMQKAENGKYLVDCVVFSDGGRILGLGAPLSVCRARVRGSGRGLGSAVLLAHHHRRQAAQGRQCKRHQSLRFGFALAQRTRTTRGTPCSVTCGTRRTRWHGMWPLQAISARGAWESRSENWTCTRCARA
jgi:hypothetical protein